MNFIKNIPVYIISADLLTSVFFNIKDALLPTATPLPSDQLPVSPEFAFGWIQVGINGVMVLLILWAMWTLLRLKKYGDAGETLAMTLPHAFASLIVLAFSVPATWLWFNALWNLLIHQRQTISFTSLRYLIVAGCLPYLLWLFLSVWYRQHRLRHQKQPALFSVQTEVPENLRSPD